MLGEKIKTLRLDRGFSQEELAKRLSVVRQTVSKWEKGLSLPDSDMLITLAEIFEISVGDLLEENTKVKATTDSKPHPLKLWEIVLLVLGSPIWLSLAVAVFAIMLALYAVVWSVIIALWAIFASLIGGSFAGIGAGLIFVLTNNAPTGFAVIGAGITCAGLAILMFFACKAATNGVVVLTKKIAVWLKNRLIKKEETP